jgi:hypothetical protein
MTNLRRGGRYFRGTRTVIHHDANRLSEGGHLVPEALGR